MKQTVEPGATCTSLPTGHVVPHADQAQHADRFDHQGGGKYESDHLADSVQCPGAEDVLHGHRLAQRECLTQQHGKHRPKNHDPQTAQLNQAQYYRLPHDPEITAGIFHDQTRHTGGAGRREQGINETQSVTRSGPG